MCFCMHISNRAQCVFNGISITVSCFVALSFLLYRGRYDTFNFILLAGLIITILAVFCLILGAVLIVRVLLWVWVGVSLPATLVVFIAHCLILGPHWDSNLGFANAVNIIFIVLYTVMILFSFCYALLFLRELSNEFRDSGL